MPTSPIQSLPAISLVRDPLQVYFQDPANPASGNSQPTELEVQVEVEEQYGSGTYKRVGEMLNPYGPDNRAGALIHRALMGALKATPPDLSTSTVQGIETIIRRYRLLARDIIGGQATSEFHATSPANAWLAGRSYIDFGKDLLTGNAYLWLSTRPRERRIHPQEKIVLYLLPLVSASAGLSVQIHFTDGTSQIDTSKTFGSLTAYRPVYLNYTIPAVTKSISHITFQATGFSVGEKLTYRMIQNPGPYFRQVLYLNSLGGFDSIAMVGKTEVTQTDSGEVFEGQLFPPLDAQEGNHRAINQTSVVGFKLRTGWISLAERTALKDLTLRNEAYLVDGNKLVKLLITNSNYLIQKDGEFLYSLEITAREAFKNASYSPL